MAILRRHFITYKMAAERSKRNNAGRNISKFLEQEIEGDEFYKTAYGGFEEGSEDNEYQTEDEEDDVIDSDFDISEKEELIEKDEEFEPKPKKRKWIKPLVTKLKDPGILKPRRRKAAAGAATTSSDTMEPRTLRQSTLALSKTKELLRSREQKRKYAHKKSRQSNRLTQEQLLEEAKITEIENLASLQSYSQLEAEKSSYKTKKLTLRGPIIRYHSIVMPSVDDASQQVNPYSRNFVIFRDADASLSSLFPKSGLSRPKRIYCPITGLPAKYIDPLTKSPYATLQAFRIIRNKYVKEKEEKCEERLQQLSSWLEEKKKLREQSIH